MKISNDAQLWAAPFMVEQPLFIGSSSIDNRC